MFLIVTITTNENNAIVKKSEEGRSGGAGTKGTALEVSVTQAFSEFTLEPKPIWWEGTTHGSSVIITVYT